jgi:putative Mn2+ efflux pump MntP
MYEHKKQPLASMATFYGRILRSITISLLVIAVCLAIGTAGYHYTCDMSWLDAFHNASMILSGMGLVDHVGSDSGKLFSSVYALFSGIVFITNVGIILAPALHRIYHRMHIDR